MTLLSFSLFFTLSCRISASIFPLSLSFSVNLSVCLSIFFVWLSHVPWFFFLRKKKLFFLLWSIFFLFHYYPFCSLPPLLYLFFLCFLMVLSFTTTLFSLLLPLVLAFFLLSVYPSLPFCPLLKEEKQMERIDKKVGLTGKTYTKRLREWHTHTHTNRKRWSRPSIQGRNLKKKRRLR